MDYRARYQGGVLRLLTNTKPDLDEGEVWKVIDEAPEYSVSSHGYVRRDAGTDHRGWKVSTAGKLIRQRVVQARSGHLMVTLSTGGKIIHRLVHRLVAKAFLPSPHDNRPFVCHKDGNPANNNAANLYWGNGAMNAADRTRHGKTLRGKDVGGAKLDELKVQAIREAARSGQSQKAISASFGVSQSNVCMIVNRKTWAHVA